MRARTAFLALTIAAAGGATAIVPSLASPQGTTPTITAQDFHFVSDGGASPNITIPVGGTVQFAYPTGTSQHNVDFVSQAPSACSQSAGSSSGTVPPLPHNPSAPGWSGSCTFNQAGTYTFMCDLHHFMTGTITVGSSTTTSPTTTTTTPPGTTTSPPPTSTAGPAPPPDAPPSSGTGAGSPSANAPAGSPSTVVSIARRQRGHALHLQIRSRPSSRVTAQILRGRRVLGRASAVVPAGGALTLGVPLNSTGRALQRRFAVLTLSARVQVAGRIVTTTVRLSR